MIWRVAIAMVYRCTFQLVFNIVFNLYHVIRILVTGKMPKAIIAYKKMSAAARDGYAPAMTYGYDGVSRGGLLGKWPCWTALSIVFAGMGGVGNCMDGAHFMCEAMGGHVKVWIPDGPRWWLHIHYVALTGAGRVWSLETRGLKSYKSLEACRCGGRWI